MANTKISALTGATTPLAGTEVLPIVQSSTTKQVSVANLTAGRAVSAASLALTTSPLPTTSGGTGSSSAFTANGVAYASSTTVLATGSALVFDGTNLGVGVTSNLQPLGVGNSSATTFGLLRTGVSAIAGNIGPSINFYLAQSASTSLIGDANLARITASPVNSWGGYLQFFTKAADGTPTNAPTESARIDPSGNFIVGATSQINGERFSVVAGATNGVYFKNTSAASYTELVWNSGTTGDNALIAFGTEATYTGRGSITYNRAGGLVAYNVTSDYRAKDISGPVINSGTLIDSVPVYMGKMKDATQERPMFIAHETPAYAHTGVKDAVDADGNPVYQQMDASALIPVMWAEIQDLRKRLADAGI